jgi:hypothetical protein
MWVGRVSVFTENSIVWIGLGGFRLFFKHRTSDSNRKIGAMARFVRSGINLAPTQKVKQCVVGAGFTPARMGWRYL